MWVQLIINYILIYSPSMFGRYQPSKLADKQLHSIHQLNIYSLESEEAGGDQEEGEERGVSVYDG